MDATNWTGSVRDPYHAFIISNVLRRVLWVDPPSHRDCNGDGFCDSTDTFRDAHNRLYSPHALYSYAHSLVKRLIWTGKGEPGGHACESPTSERPRQLTIVAILRMLRWALRLVVVIAQKVSSRA